MKISFVGGAIGALVLVNAAAFVAVEQHFQVSAVASPVASGSASSTAPSTASPAATTNPAKTTAATESVADTVRSPGVFVTAANADRAWRAVNSGGCDGSVQVQTTQDGGRTWSGLAKPPAGAADAVGIDGTGHLQLSGQASQGCAQQSWSLGAAGSWYTSGAVAWTLKGAKSADVIHAGKQLKACGAGSVIDLATAGDAADVLCSDGSVRAVSAAGKADTVYQGNGLISIGTTSDDTLIVARSVKDCNGVELATISNKTAKKLTCVDGASKAVDLTFAGDNGWLVAAHNTWTGGTSGSWSKS